MVEEGVDEGIFGGTGAWVGDGADGFIDGDNVFVFVEDIEGDFYGAEFGGFGLWDCDG